MNHEKSTVKFRYNHLRGYVIWCQKVLLTHRIMNMKQDITIRVEPRDITSLAL